MIGAIIGDTVGSVFEFNNTKDVNFPLFCSMSSYKVLEEVMVEIASKHNSPMGGYGCGFRKWLFVPN